MKKVRKKHKKRQKITKKSKKSSKNHEKASKKWKKAPCGQQKAPAGNKSTKNSEITRKTQKQKIYIEKKILKTKKTTGKKYWPYMAIYGHIYGLNMATNLNKGPYT